MEIRIRGYESIHKGHSQTEVVERYVEIVEIVERLVSIEYPSEMISKTDLNYADWATLKNKLAETGNINKDVTEDREFNDLDHDEIDWDDFIEWVRGMLISGMANWCLASFKSALIWCYYFAEIEYEE